MDLLISRSFISLVEQFEAYVRDSERIPSLANAINLGNARQALLKAAFALLYQEPPGET